MFWTAILLIRSCCRLQKLAIENAGFIFAENKKDLAMMDASDPGYDRLMLTAGRIENIAADIRKVAALPAPIGHIVS